MFGAFGGYGLEGTGQFMASLGLTPGTLMALLASSAEFFGGLALLFGVLVRPAVLAGPKLTALGRALPRPSAVLVAHRQRPLSSRSADVARDRACD